jgi:hypothetical protein
MLCILLSVLWRLFVGATVAFVVLVLAMVAGFFGGSRGGLFGMVFWVVMFAIIWALVPIVRSMAARSEGSPRPAPSYQWTCYVCRTSNSPNQGICARCGHTANATATEIEAAEAEARKVSDQRSRP